MATQTFTVPQPCAVDCYAIAGVVLNLYAGGLPQVHYWEGNRRKTNNLNGAAAMIETYATEIIGRAQNNINQPWHGISHHGAVVGIINGHALLHATDGHNEGMCTLFCEVDHQNKTIIVHGIGEHKGSQYLMDGVSQQLDALLKENNGRNEGIRYADQKSEGIILP